MDELRALVLLVKILDKTSPSLLFAVIPNSEKLILFSSTLKSANKIVILSLNLEIRFSSITMLPS